MSKKTTVLLLSVLFFLLIYAIPLHLQKGITWHDIFWRQTDANTFTAGSKRAVSYAETDDGAVFDVTLNGQTQRLTMHALAFDRYRFESEDGWAMELTDGPSLAYTIGSMTYTLSDTPLIVTNAQSAFYQFAPCHPETSYYYDEAGQIAGEHIDLVTDGGYFISSYENWYNQPELNTNPADPILFETGLRIASDDINQALYINERGEYLTNANTLLMMKVDATDYVSKAEVLNLLVDIVQGKAVRRGHLFCFAAYIFFALIGLSMLKWPDKMAFLGSRWQYRHEPELSDAGLFFMQLSAGVMIITGVVFLFLPLFVI